MDKKAEQIAKNNFIPNYKLDNEWFLVAPLMCSLNYSNCLDCSKNDNGKCRI